MIGIQLVSEEHRDTQDIFSIDMLCTRYFTYQFDLLSQTLLRFIFGIFIYTCM